MKNKIAQLVAFLNAQTVFTATIGARLFPLVAEKGTERPFVVYSVGSQPVSKDGREYNAGLQLFFEPNQFTEMTEFSDALVALLDEEYDGGTVDQDYSPDFAAIFTTINFNIH